VLGAMTATGRDESALHRLPELPTPAAGRTGSGWVEALACIAIAALSLLWAHEPTYDPTAWLVWGRELIHGDLVTLGGPSWKPLPVFFTTPFALFGSSVAPLLWLIVARASGLYAVVLAYRLATRIAGPVAGVVATVALLLESVFIYHFARGNSEGLQTMLALLVVERHLDGHRRQAFWLCVAGGLLRPEAWPLLAGYGLWLIWVEWRERGALPWGTVAMVVGSGVALLLIWFVPEYVGSHNLLRAADRAADPVAGSPGEAAFPFLATFTNAAGALLAPVYVGGFVAVAAALASGARRPGDKATLGIAALSTAFMCSVALGAEVAFTGNQRYLIVAAALACVVCGVGWAELVGLARRGLGRRAFAAVCGVLVLAVAPFAVAGAVRLADRLDGIRTESQHYTDLKAAIRAAGGPAALKRCGTVYTTRFDTQAVAYDLHLHLSQAQIFPAVPGTIVAARTTALARDPRFPHVLARTPSWTIAVSCPV
jgi:hypothetical protein